jgi:DNA helicase-2/ATP-dependent DNA helicase PcrA
LSGGALEDLNPEQAAAVRHGRGPLLVLAGAGSGKTRVVTRRLAELLSAGADPRRIVAVTFTNKAASEMRERVRALVGARRLESFVGTFHAWGLGFLRRHSEAAGRNPGFRIADAADQIALVREALEEAGLSEQSFPPPAVHGRISAAKGALVSARRFAEAETDFAGSRVARVYEIYEKKLQAADAVDFDDLIARPVRALRGDPELLASEQERVEHLLIDEYQDTNRAQDALVKLLAGKAVSLCAVGDEDQSIYGWRGARVEHILKFEEDFPGSTVVSLTRNYRSTQKILEAAGAVVSRNRRRRGKTLVSQGAEGEDVELRIFADDRAEAEWAASRIETAGRPASDFAVLFRVNAQSRAFEDELVRRRIPYVVIGGMKFYERAEVRDAVAYYRLALRPEDDLAFRRVVNVPARGIGAATLERVFERARAAGLSLFEASASVEGVTERGRIALERFRAIIEEARGRSRELSPSGLLEHVLESSGYSELFSRSDDREDVARSENLRELVSAAREYELRQGEEATVEGFLDAMALATDADAPAPGGTVSLLTLHSAKGLEFPEVIVAGLEEGFLPHAQSSGSEEEVEEERRLLYVGMTRARESLTLTMARQRLVYGEVRLRQPSRFAEDLPEGAVRRVDDGLWSEPAETPAPERREERFEAPPRPVSAARRRSPLPGAVPGMDRGRRVRHPRYGLGTVLQQEGSGEQARLTVYFDRAGKKKFVAKFAQLTPA